MLPWVALVVAVALSIRFGIEWILRRLGVQRVEPEQPNGIQHLAGQVEQWAHNRRAQVAERSADADDGSPRAARRAAREQAARERERNRNRNRSTTNDGPDSSSSQ